MLLFFIFPLLTVHFARAMDSEQQIWVDGMSNNTTEELIILDQNSNSYSVPPGKQLCLNLKYNLLNRESFKFYPTKIENNKINAKYGYFLFVSSYNIIYFGSLLRAEMISYHHDINMLHDDIVVDIMFQQDALPSLIFIQPKKGKSEIVE
jgi:hypothetical protein